MALSHWQPEATPQDFWAESSDGGEGAIQGTQMNPRFQRWDLISHEYLGRCTRFE
jgi:hypothetical protein